MGEHDRSTSGGKGRRVVVAICVGVPLLLLARWFQGNITPPIVIPPKLAPSPNAFDNFTAAASNASSIKQINAASIAGQPPNLAIEAQLVNLNRPVLTTLRQGFQYEYLDMSRRSVSTVYRYFAGYRALARLLVMEGDIRASKGDRAGAADCYLDVIELGEMCPRGAVIIGELVGVGCQALGRKPLWKLSSQLSATESMRIATRLESIMRKHVPFTDTLTEEKYFGENTLYELFRNRFAYGAMASATGGPNGSSGAPLSLTSLYFMFHSKSTVLHAYADYMDAEIANDAKPYSKSATPVPLPNDQFVKMMSPVFAPARLKDLNTGMTQNSILLVTLALHGFDKDHGRYPTTLQELVPMYLKQLPADPFALSGTLKYHLEHGKYLLYSVGPDGVDDGGRAIDDPSQATASNNVIRYYVEPNSKGDIVAGTNIY